MKFKFEEKHEKLGLSLFFAGSGIVLVYLLLTNFNYIYAGLTKMFEILFPFISGFVLAFFLLPLQKWAEKNLSKYTKLSKGIIKTLSIIFVLIFFIAVLSLAFALIVPSLISSLVKLSETISLYIENPYVHLPFLQNTKIIAFINEWWKNEGTETIAQLTNLIKNFVPSILSYSLVFVQRTLGFIVGIFVMVYGLFFKERLVIQFKQVSYAIFPKKIVDEIIDVLRFTSEIFNGFVVGKLIDSLIVGIICYVVMSLLKIEYALLISSIVAITNIIPVFGPFIGAVPGFAILIIINPIQALIFLVWILILQQFDGNILGPHILGDKVGLPSIWVMFAIIVGGGLWGFVGMFVGVPLFAVIYALFGRWVKKRLKIKNIKIEA